MDPAVRSVLEGALQAALEEREDAAREIRKAQSNLEVWMGRRDRAAEQATALEKELYADRSYAEAVCIVAGCGLPRYIHGGPGRPTASSHRFQGIDDA